MKPPNETTTITAWDLPARVRAGDWWSYKVAAILATGYATAALLGLSPASILPTLVFIIAAIVPVAAFASLVNDACDRVEDRIAGKTNKLEGLSQPTVAALFSACIALGVVMTGAISSSPLTAAVYVANWLVFALYSIPPMRLKRRGFLGVVAIALGESLLPHLFALLVVAGRMPQGPPPSWVALVSVWAFAVGTRSILWHQLKDHDGDLRSGAATFAVTASPRFAAFLGTWVVFPVEVAAFLGMLVLLGLEAAWVLLIVYVLTELGRNRAWHVPVVIVRPAPNDRLFLFEYYDTFYPMACIASAVPADPANLFLLLVVCCYTPRPWWWIQDALLIGRVVSRRIRSYRASASTATAVVSAREPHPVRDGGGPS